MKLLRRKVKVFPKRACRVVSRIVGHNHARNRLKSRFCSRSNYEFGHQMKEHKCNCVPHKTLIYQRQNGMLFLAKSTEKPRISEGIK